MVTLSLKAAGLDLASRSMSRWARKALQFSQSLFEFTKRHCFRDAWAIRPMVHSVITFQLISLSSYWLMIWLKNWISNICTVNWYKIFLKVLNIYIFFWWMTINLLKYSKYWSSKEILIIDKYWWIIDWNVMTEGTIGLIV